MNKWKKRKLKVRGEKAGPSTIDAAFLCCDDAKSQATKVKLDNKLGAGQPIDVTYHPNSRVLTMVMMISRSQQLTYSKEQQLPMY
jgi:hypothetical protein